MRATCARLSTAADIGHRDRDSPAAPGTQTAQKQHTGLLDPDARPSAASIRLPESARCRNSLPQCAHPAAYRHAWLHNSGHHELPPPSVFSISRRVVPLSRARPTANASAPTLARAREKARPGRCCQWQERRARPGENTLRLKSAMSMGEPPSEVGSGWGLVSPSGGTWAGL
jgi:hypothetical protein